MDSDIRVAMHIDMALRNYLFLYIMYFVISERREKNAACKAVQIVGFYLLQLL